MDKCAETLRWLDEKEIKYNLVEHPAAYTIEDMDSFSLTEYGFVWKNLFLRDAKGKRHFLVSLDGHKTVDLKTLGETLGTKLSFASEERLGKYLNLTKGAVTPLGVLYDKEAVVEVILDRELASHQVVGVHPCVNTATVFMNYDDLLDLIRQNGNPISFIDI